MFYRLLKVIGRCQFTDCRTYSSLVNIPRSYGQYKRWYLHLPFIATLGLLLYGNCRTSKAEEQSYPLFDDVASILREKGDFSVPYYENNTEEFRCIEKINNVGVSRGRSGNVNSCTFNVDEISSRYKLYGIFEGHNGFSVSHTAKIMIKDILKETFDILNVSNNPQTIIPSVMYSLLKFDNEYIQLLVRRQLTEYESYVSGSSALVLLENNGAYTIANAGESRAIVCVSNSDSTYGMPLTNDMTCNQVTEISRILQLSDNNIYEGIFRKVDDQLYIKGLITNTRGIGDIYLKLSKDDLPIVITPENIEINNDELPLITAFPDAYTYIPQIDDKYIIIGTSNIWDHLTHDEAANLAMNVKEPQLIADKIIEITKKKLLGGISEDQFRRLPEELRLGIHKELLVMVIRL